MFTQFASSFLRTGSKLKVKVIETADLQMFPTFFFVNIRTNLLKNKIINKLKKTYLLNDKKKRCKNE